MPAKTFTVTLPSSRLKFIDEYRKAHALKSRSDVIEIALSQLRESEHDAGISEPPEQDDLSDVSLGVTDATDEESR